MAAHKGAMRLSGNRWVRSTAHHPAQGSGSPQAAAVAVRSQHRLRRLSPHSSRLRTLLPAVLLLVVAGWWGFSQWRVRPLSSLCSELLLNATMRRQMSHNEETSQVLRETIDILTDHHAAKAIADAAVHSSVRFLAGLPEAPCPDCRQPCTTLSAAATVSASSSSRSSSVSGNCSHLWEDKRCTCAATRVPLLMEPQSGAAHDRARLKLPLCKDGMAPGRWVNTSMWEADACRYRHIPMEQLKHCLRSKWVHFVGDTSSRLLASRLASRLGIRKFQWGDNATSASATSAAEPAESEADPPTESQEGESPPGEDGQRATAETHEGTEEKAAKRALLTLEVGWRRGSADRQWSDLWEEGTEGGVLHTVRQRRRLQQVTGRPASQAGSSNEAPGAAAEAAAADALLLYVRQQRAAGLSAVTYSFRAKMAHQRAPGPGDTEESDLNNAFFNAIRPPRRDHPDAMVMSMGAHEVVGWSGRPRVRLDMDTFKQDTEDLLGLVRSAYPHGRLIWWKAYYIHQGKARGQVLFNVRKYHEMYQDYALQRFRRAGYDTADFYQTTKPRPEACAGDGVNYRREIPREHERILENMLCN